MARPFELALFLAVKRCFGENGSAPMPGHDASCRKSTMLQKHNRNVPGIRICHGSRISKIMHHRFDNLLRLKQSETELWMGLFNEFRRL
jgi:hypothetical protein